MHSPAQAQDLGLTSPSGVSERRLTALRDAMALCVPRSEALSSSATPQDRTLQDSAALRAKGHSPEDTAWALTQRAFRAAAEPKFGPHALSSLYTRAGLEQASRRELAEHHARLLLDAGAKTVIDAGSGLGADSLAFLDAGLDVVSLEIDPDTAALTAYNLAQHPRAAHAQVWIADVMSVLDSELIRPGGAWAEHSLWFDPARRESGASGRRRVFDPEEFSPPLSAIAAVARQNPRRVVSAKLGPALDAAQVPETFDVEWITHRQDTSEAVILTPAENPALTARRIASDGSVHTMTAPRALGEPRGASHSDGIDLAPAITAGDILWEPVGSVLRAGFVQQLGAELDADLLAPDIAYVLSAAESTARPDSHPMATPYRVLETLPLHAKQMKAWVKRNQVTELTIKKRGIDVDPAALRKQLLAGSGKGPRRAATLVLTRHGATRVCVVVESVK